MYWNTPPHARLFTGSSSTCSYFETTHIAHCTMPEIWLWGRLLAIFFYDRLLCYGNKMRHRTALQMMNNTFDNRLNYWRQLQTRRIKLLPRRCCDGCWQTTVIAIIRLEYRQTAATNANDRGIGIIRSAGRWRPPIASLFWIYGMLDTVFASIRRRTSVCPDRGRSSGSLRVSETSLQRCFFLLYFKCQQRTICQRNGGSAQGCGTEYAMRRLAATAVSLCAYVANTVQLIGDFRLWLVVNPLRLQLRLHPMYNCNARQWKAEVDYFATPLFFFDQTTKPVTSIRRSVHYPNYSNRPVVAASEKPNESGWTAVRWTARPSNWFHKRRFLIALSPIGPMA